MPAGAQRIGQGVGEIGRLGVVAAAVEAVVEDDLARLARGHLFVRGSQEVRDLRAVLVGVGFELDRQRACVADPEPPERRVEIAQRDRQRLAGLVSLPALVEALQPLVREPALGNGAGSPRRRL